MAELDWTTKHISACEVAQTNKLELLKWAREEKKCEWDDKTINTAAYQGNLEMVKYCVANQCPMDGRACAYAAESGHLEVLKYLHEEVKAPWGWRTAFWRLKMVISTYSNILLSVNMINMSEVRVYGRPVRPLRLFEVLARNRQSALELFGRTRSAREQPLRMFTIPPRQRLSSPNRLAIRRRNVTHVLNTCSDTQRERERERDNEKREKYYYPKNKKEVVRRETHPPIIIHLRKRLKKSKTDLLSNARESLVFSTRDERYSLSWSRLTDSERVLTRS